MIKREFASYKIKRLGSKRLEWEVVRITEGPDEHIGTIFPSFSVPGFFAGPFPTTHNGAAIELYPNFPTFRAGAKTIVDISEAKLKRQWETLQQTYG